MKRISSSLSCLLWILLSLNGCNGTPTGIEAALGEEFSLPIGQEVRITGENLRVKFVDVIDDSRCPEGSWLSPVAWWAPVLSAPR